MLYLGTTLYNRIMKIPIVCIVVSSDNKVLSVSNRDTQEFLVKVKNAVIHSCVDTAIVGGITFFSSMVTIGTTSLLVNIKMAFISSVVAAGLSFFVEMRKKMEDIDK